MAAINLGNYLKYGRTRARLSVLEVARRVGVAPFDVMTWERNDGRTLRLEIVNELVRLYRLDVEIVFDLLLQYQLSRIEKKLNRLLQRKLE
jgi:hypothetical protein